MITPTAFKCGYQSIDDPWAQWTGFCFGISIYFNIAAPVFDCTPELELLGWAIVFFDLGK